MPQCLARASGCFRSTDSCAPGVSTRACQLAEDRISIFFVGDEQNPLLDARLAGRISPCSSKWRLATSDRFRCRQRDPSAAAPVLEIVLAKAEETPGMWPKAPRRSSCTEHRLLCRIGLMARGASRPHFGEDVGRGNVICLRV